MKQGWEIKKLGEVCLIDNGQLKIENEKQGLMDKNNATSEAVNAQLNKGWEIKKLGEVCEFRNGAAHEQYIDENGKYILINSKFISADGEKLKRTNKALSPLFVNDIAFVMSDVPKGRALAKCFLVDKDDTYTLNQRIGAIRSKVFIPKFLVYQFNRNKYLLSFDNGENQTNLRKNDILNTPLFVPPLPTQHHIVSILDKAFLAIERSRNNAEQNLKNAKELFESVLNQLIIENEKLKMDWEEKKLGEVAFVKSGGTPSRSKKEFWEGNIAWYSSGELNDTYTIEPERFINELAIENSNAKLFPKGSLLIGMYDTAALKMSIIDRDATFNQAIAGVKPNPKIDLHFILHAINSQKPELLNLRRGTRQKNLSLEKIKDISIPFPPLATQRTIVRQLDALRAETQKLEAIYQQKIANLEELKKSILQKAFAGELRGGEPVEPKTEKSRRDDKIIEKMMNE
ncbi:MAG: restriction endonuclease subunit S [Bacteroidetes bacterium]|nr:restriction endonuclease subunit S [Bacteroidota bacterium]